MHKEKLFENWRQFIYEKRQLEEDYLAVLSDGILENLQYNNAKVNHHRTYNYNKVIRFDYNKELILTVIIDIHELTVGLITKDPFLYNEPNIETVNIEISGKNVSEDISKIVNAGNELINNGEQYIQQMKKERPSLYDFR